MKLLKKYVKHKYMSCTKISKTNKGQSILFDYIYNNVANENESLATFYYNHFQTKQFENTFGLNYIEDFKKGIHSSRLYENGEPKLLFDNETKQHYFLDKDNQKVNFPIAAKGLSQMWSGEMIKNVTSRLVKSYVEKGPKLDFENIDFKTPVKLPKIDKFIVNEINNRIAYLEANDKYENILFLEEALNHVDELETLMLKKFRSLGTDIKDDDDTSEIDILEEETRENQIGTSSMSRSSKSKISTDIKLRLSFLVDTKKTDELWDDNVLMDFDVVYKKLQELLGNVIPLEGEYLPKVHLDILEENSKYFPYIKELHTTLSNSKDENLINQFSQSFYMAKYTFVNEEYSNTEQGNKHKTIDLTNKNDEFTKIKDLFINNFKASFVTNVKFNESSLKLINNLVENINKKVKEVSGYSNETKQAIATINNYGSLVKETLSKLEIQINDSAFERYLDLKPDSLNELSDKDRLEVFNKINKLANTLDNYILKYITKNSKSDNFDVTKLFQSSNEINKLIKAQVFVNNNRSDSNVYVGGEKRWLYSNPSYLHMTLERWKKDPASLLKEYKSDVYLNGGSDWIRQWFELDREMDDDERIEVAKKNMANVKLGVLGELTLVNEGDKKKNEYRKPTDVVYKDYLVNNVNTVLKEGSFNRTITQADKATEFTLKTLTNKIQGFLGYKKLDDQKGVFIIKEEAKKTFFNYYVSEINEMIKGNNEVEISKANNNIKLTPHYHYQYEIKDADGKTILNPNVYDKSGNVFKSGYFEGLNFKTAKTSLEKQIVNLVYDKKGNFNITNLDKDLKSQLESLFGDYLEEMMYETTRSTINEFVSLGIVKLKDGLYVNSLIDFELFDDIRETNTPQGNHTAVFKMAMNYMLNGMSNNIEYTKLFTGSIAYYKNSVDFKKRIPATYTDGKYLILKPGEEDFRTATINAVNIDSPFLKRLKEAGVDEHTIKMLTNINSTDAQAWITPKRWKFLTVALGKWSNAHDEVFRKMQSDVNENWTKDELKIAAQPLKGVYFYKINGKPTYLKYSQAVLSNTLVKGTDLERVLANMNKSNVDELITFDGVKVGAIEPTTIHNLDGTIVADKDFKLNVQTLSNHGWKLQYFYQNLNFEQIAL